MIEIKKIQDIDAFNYIKTVKGFNETQANDELLFFKVELETTVFLKGKGTSIKGAIFKKFVSEGTNHWLGAFDGEKLVGIHWHSIAYTGNNEQSDLKDVFDGQLYADNEDIARELHKEFDRLIKGKYVVNYSFSFPGDDFDLNFRKSLGYIVWATIDWKAKGKKLRTPGTLHFLKRVDEQGEKNKISKEEIRQMKIADLKKQLEELNA
ncbi:MAG: hypothetical protein H8E55_06115 [Pelagibacterales bacterium]|nr:hypothetical protein [Pelagibacterales bacterium]